VEKVGSSPQADPNEALFVPSVCAPAQGLTRNCVVDTYTRHGLHPGWGGYVDGKQPWGERRARRDSVIVRVVVCIVRALQEEGPFRG
jgi:hypothetical protein